jgi:large subunit ribosomal protein L41
MSAWSMLASAFARGRRVPRSGYKQLTSKVAPRTFYKGKGCAPTGRHTRKGNYLRAYRRLDEIFY